MGGRSIIQEAVDSGRFDMTDLSRKADRNAAYIQQFLKRHVPQELPEAAREKLAPILGVTPNALREGLRASLEDALPRFASGSDVRPAPGVLPPEPKRLPLSARVEVLGVVEAGSDGQFVVNLTDGPLEEVDLPSGLVGVPDIFALFVAGESMAGVWMPGDQVFVSRRRPVTPGCYVVVEVETGPGEPPRVFLKQFVSRSDNRVRLLQYNPSMDVTIDASKVRSMFRALHWREWAV